MVAELREHVGGGLMILTHLRTAIGVRESKPAAACGKAFGKTVHAANKRDHPYVIADADASIGMAERLDHRGGLALHILELRLIPVLKHLAEVRLHIVHMDVLSFCYGSRRVPDGHAVLDYVLAFGDVSPGILVSIFVDFHIVERINDHYLIHIEADPC